MNTVYASFDKTNQKIAFKYPTEIQNTFSASNVGIGTTLPSAKLDVIGATKISSNLSVLGNVGIGTANPTVALDVLGTTKVSTSLGIGTTPTTQLDVVGNAKLTGTVSALQFNITGTGAAEQIFRIQSTDGTTGGIALYHGNDDILKVNPLNDFTSVNIKGSTISLDGAVTINNSVGVGLNVQGETRVSEWIKGTSANGLKIVANDATTNMQFWTGGYNRLTISNTGQVGVGTSPDASFSLITLGAIKAPNATIDTLSNITAGITYLTAATLGVTNDTVLSGYLITQKGLTKTFNGLTQSVVLSKYYTNMAFVSNDMLSSLSGTSPVPTVTTPALSQTFNTAITTISGWRTVDIYVGAAVNGSVFHSVWWDDTGADKGLMMIKITNDDAVQLRVNGALVYAVNYGTGPRCIVCPVQRFTDFEIIVNNSTGATGFKVEYQTLYAF